MIPGFQEQIITLAEQATSHGAAAAAPGQTDRRWQLPAGTLVVAGADVQNPDVLIAACDRYAANVYCGAAYGAGTEPNSPTGRRGVVMAAKTAIAYVSALERALHARHASPVRLRAWAAARRQGHGDAVSGVFGAVLKAVNAMEAAAIADPNDPSALLP